MRDAGQFCLRGLSKDPEHDALPDRIAYFGDVGGLSSTVRPACANDDSLTGLAHAWRPAATGPTVERTVGLFLLSDYSRFECHALIETFKKANEVLSGVRYDVVAIESEGKTCTDPTTSVEPIALPGQIDAAACDCLIVLGGSLKTWSKGCCDTGSGPDPDRRGSGFRCASWNDYSAVISAPAPCSSTGRCA